jgi:ubiquinone/menaquinone biosynthesis C-methylase UbiE
MKNKKNKWLNIWSSKNLPNRPSLKDMIIANGWNTNFGSYSEIHYKKMVKDFCIKMKLKKNFKILELGCGSGAFIFCLKKLVQANYYGIDYSQSLVNAAKKIMPTENFICSEVNVEHFHNVKFDIIFAHSVLNYFPNYQYLDKVLNIWSRKLKSKGKLVLMDLNDKKKKFLYLDMRMSSYKSIKDYKKDYKGLNHLYFDQGLLKKKLNKYGIMDIKSFLYPALGNLNSKFRFSIFGTKNLSVKSKSR